MITMTINREEYYTIEQARQLLGYKTKSGIRYLLNSGRIKEENLKFDEKGALGYATIYIKGSALEDIKQHPRYSRYSFKSGLRQE